MSAAEARSRAVWASRTQSRALTTELLELLLQLAKFRIDIDSYYIFKLQLLFTLSRDCHLLSHSNCCFHYRNTVTILDTLLKIKVTRNEKKNLVWVFFMQKYYDKIQSVLLDNFIKRILLISEE